MSWPRGLQHPSALLCSPRAVVSVPTRHTPAPRTVRHVVVHTASSPQSHTSQPWVPGEAGPPLHVCLPLWSPLSSLPSQSAVAGDRTTCPGHSLARWYKLSGIRRRWESPPSQGGRKGAESPPEPCAHPLPASQGTGAQCFPRRGHQPSQLEGCLLSPLQFRSACSEQMTTETEHMGPKVTGHSGRVTLLPGWTGGAPRLRLSFSLCSSQGHEVASPEPPGRKCTHLGFRKSSLCQAAM